MRIQTVTGKLAGMRKPQEFVVYPFQPGEAITVQSDKAIGRFDPVTREGVLNWRGSNAKYFPHLLAHMGAEPYTFPADFVDFCISFQPVSGDEIGPGVYVG